MSTEVRLFDANGHDTSIELSEVRLDQIGPEQLVWADMDRDADGLTAVAEALGVESGLASFGRASSRPEVTHGENVLRVRAIGLGKDGDEVKAVPVDFLAQRGLVISVHEGDVAGLDGPVARAEGETLLGKLDAGSFLALLLDGMLEGYFDAVERIEAKIDRIDVEALATNDADRLVVAMVSLRREIAHLRRALAPQRAVFSSLTGPDAELQTDLLGSYWPGLAQRFQLAVDALENARELLIGSFDIVMTRTGQRTNDVMRVLTVISAVLLPSVVLAGVMGMNFKLDFFDTAGNFFVVLGAMAVLAAAVLLVGRWRGWI